MILKLAGNRYSPKIHATSSVIRCASTVQWTSEKRSMYPGCGLGYQCIYFSKELVEPISLARFSYNSIRIVLLLSLWRHWTRPASFPCELSGTSIKRKRSSDWISWQRDWLSKQSFPQSGRYHANCGNLGSDYPKRNSTQRLLLRKWIP